MSKPAGMGAGDRLSVFAFDNPDCLTNDRSGYLGALDVTTPSAFTVQVATDRRLYLRGLGQISSVSMRGPVMEHRVTPCAEFVSFTPRPGAAYRVSHSPTAEACGTTVVDAATGRAPADFEQHAMGEVCREFTGLVKD